MRGAAAEVPRIADLAGTVRVRVALTFLAVAAAPACTASTTAARTPAGTAMPPAARSATTAPVFPSPTMATPVASEPWRFGTSRDGVPLIAVERRSAGARRRLLVVGCIHGDEQAGVTIVEAMLHQPLPANVDVVLVASVNPDGQRRQTRQNAAGVDLNRNFPFGWRALGHRGDQQFSGTGPLSEPESLAVTGLISRLRPDVTVWFHQPVDVVDDSGGDPALERAFAVRVGQRFTRLVRYPGSVASWQDSRFPGTSAFVDELPRTLTGDRVLTFTTALWWLASRP
ncbi:MAG: DUF2817 domain-containing protein [Actinomycetota bacterium]|nr:DUF2817 domain-containing protein [Actinomycetota bacterium]